MPFDGLPERRPIAAHPLLDQKSQSCRSSESGFVCGMAAARLLTASTLGVDSAHPFYLQKFGLYATSNHSAAVGRPLFSHADKAMYTPDLDALFNELDAIVEDHAMRRKAKDRGAPPTEAQRIHAAGVSTLLRAGSTARYRHQTDFYYRLGTSPWVQTVCEVGARAHQSACHPLGSEVSHGTNSRPLARV